MIIINEYIHRVSGFQSHRSTKRVTIQEGERKKQPCNGWW